MGIPGLFRKLERFKMALFFESLRMVMVGDSGSDFEILWVGMSVNGDGGVWLLVETLGVGVLLVEDR